jgi:hypothetical protein
VQNIEVELDKPRDVPEPEPRPVLTPPARQLNEEGLQTSLYSTRQSKLDRWPWIVFTSPQPIMAEQKKQEKDFTVEVDVLISKATALAQVGFRFQRVCCRN